MFIIRRILCPRSYRDLALIWALLVVIVGGAAGVNYLVVASAGASPNCPTEDSCTASYSHGHWTIREVTP